MNADAELQILRLLEQDPELSQREIGRRVGFSLGKTNYCLRALVNRGLIKVQRFRKSTAKARYFYKLTPSGLREKAALTRKFLTKQLHEYERLSSEIERLRAQVRMDESNKGN